MSWRKKSLGFLAWLAAFVGGSTVYGPTCAISGDGIFVNVPGSWWGWGCGDDDDCEDYWEECCDD